MRLWTVRYLKGNPLAVIEGMVIAGYAIGAQNGYFYVRAEYPVAVTRSAYRNRAGYRGNGSARRQYTRNRISAFRVHIRLGAGAFVCGEETALLNSIEGQTRNAASASAVPGG